MSVGKNYSPNYSYSRKKPKSTKKIVAMLTATVVGISSFVYYKANKHNDGFVEVAKGITVRIADNVEVPIVYGAELPLIVKEDNKYYVDKCKIWVKYKDGKLLTTCTSKIPIKAGFVGDITFEIQEPTVVQPDISKDRFETVYNWTLQEVKYKPLSPELRL
jgi:aspartate-semialdehyde dehydrogenase